MTAETEADDGRRSPERPERSQSPNLAQIIAERVEADVISKGWPIGEVLGSEASLIDRYGVSRAVFREAVRIVEHHGIARMRRGPGGGLVVTRPDPAAIQHAARLYLQYAGVQRNDLFQARSALEIAGVAAATENMNEENIALLRAALAEEQADLHAGSGHSRRLHVVISELTGNPALVLFVDVLTKLDEEIVVRSWESGGEPPEAMVASHHAHVAIAEAMTSGDVSLAQHRMRRHLDAIAALTGT
jgi:DNA-binding FadR family transcriptional regulator